MAHVAIASKATQQALESASPPPKKKRGKWEKVLDDTGMALDMMPLGLMSFGSAETGKLVDKIIQKAIDYTASRYYRTGVAAAILKLGSGNTILRQARNTFGEYIDDLADEVARGVGPKDGQKTLDFYRKVQEGLDTAANWMKEQKKLSNTNLDVTPNLEDWSQGMKELRGGRF